MNYDFGSQQSQQRRTGSNSQQPEPYELLNLPRDADIEAIKQRFRTLTRVHHPDRNRRNSNYDPNYYAGVCAAYETLSDPRKRAAFDQASAASFHVLRNAALESQRAAGDANKAEFVAKQRFASEGDLRQFNEAFEKQRKLDPNDRGYGDTMASRMTEKELASGRRPLDTPVNVFGATKVSDAAFNSRFQSELQAKRKARAPAMMERADSVALRPARDRRGLIMAA